MFGEHYRLQNRRKFSIGQSRQGLALLAVETLKNKPMHETWSQPIAVSGFFAFSGPYCLTMLVATGAVCRYHA
jgi:hypothetical protein